MSNQNRRVGSARRPRLISSPASASCPCARLLRHSQIRGHRSRPTCASLDSALGLFACVARYRTYRRIGERSGTASSLTLQIRRLPSSMEVRANTEPGASTGAPPDGAVHEEEEGGAALGGQPEAFEIDGGRRVRPDGALHHAHALPKRELSAAPELHKPADKGARHVIGPGEDSGGRSVINRHRSAAQARVASIAIEEDIDHANQPRPDMAIIVDITISALDNLLGWGRVADTIPQRGRGRAASFLLRSWQSLRRPGDSEAEGLRIAKTSPPIRAVLLMGALSPAIIGHRTRRKLRYPHSAKEV